MPTRRSVLGAAGGGLVAGLAGCTGILSSVGGGSGDSGGTLDVALAVDPNLQSVVEQSDWERLDASVSLEYCDSEALRDRDGPIADWATTAGTTPGFNGVEDPEAVGSTRESAYGRFETYFEDNQQLAGQCGYATGSIDREGLQAGPTDGDPDERIDGHDVYAFDDHLAIGVSDSGFGAALATRYMDADFNDAAASEYDRMAMGLLERAITRPADPPSPPGWQADAFERLAPYQYAMQGLNVSGGSQPGSLFATGFDVRGEETDVTAVIAAPSAEAFDEVWSESWVERRFGPYPEASPQFDRGDRVGGASATVSTSNTILAAEEYYR